jgi:hypothetical protein
MDDECIFHNRMLTYFSNCSSAFDFDDNSFLQLNLVAKVQGWFEFDKGE